jgi:pSer/pThr/pTyr-binding forkhead associated (FHA) protein
MAVCAICGHDTPDPEARFCAACGKPLTPVAAAEVTSVLGLAPSGTDDLAVESDTDVEPTAEDALVDRLAPGSALLVVKRGPSSGARFLLDSELTTAGRHPDSDIFLDDITVSRRHVVVEHDGEGYTLRDVGSLNGTYVNRKRVDEAQLRDRDEVQIGRFRLTFVLGGERDA